LIPDVLHVGGFGDVDLMGDEACWKLSAQVGDGFIERSWRRPVMMTLAAPALAKLRAMAKPMPPDLPVMKTTFPL